MTQHIDKVLAIEAQAVEEAEERGEQRRSLSEVTVTRGHARARTLQVRLNDDEMARIEALAATRNLPVSTLARAVLLNAVSDQSPQDVSAAVEAAIRHLIRPDLLAS